MQKKIIALAVAGIVWAPLAAHAADVTLSGVFDLGVKISDSETAGVSTGTSTVGIHNGAATSAFKITVVEDLGGGMKATGYIETDPALGTTAGAAFANAPNWLQLSGNWGALTLGYMNNYALAASSASQPYGTGLASGYNGSFGRLDGVNVLGTTSFAGPGGNGVRDIRINNSVQYQLPNFGGFTAGVIYKIKNTDAGNAAPDQIGQTQFSASFSGANFNIIGTLSSLDNTVAWAGTSTKVDHTMIGANWKLGPITLYGGWTQSSADNSADLDSSSMNFAVKWQVSPQLAIGGNFVTVDDANPGNVDRDLIGFGLDYAMSKRTTAYIRYQSGDKNKAVDNTGDYSDIGLGFVHTF
jgi:GBP family porin